MPLTTAQRKVSAMASMRMRRSAWYGKRSIFDDPGVAGKITRKEFSKMIQKVNEAATSNDEPTVDANQMCKSMDENGDDILDRAEMGRFGKSLAKEKTTQWHAQGFAEKDTRKRK
mgnify:CR=1 FL=1